MTIDIHASDWFILVPELILLATAMVLLLTDAFARKLSDKTAPWIALIGVLAVLVILGLMYGERRIGFAGMLIIDPFSVPIYYAILIGTSLSILISVYYVQREELPIGEYYALMLLSSIGMLLLVSSTNLIMIFLSLEMLSIALYVLSGIAKDRPRSQEAAMKYFLLGSFSAAILLFGSALIYGVTGTLDLRGIASAIADVGLAGDPLLLSGMGLVVVGLGFKVSVVPFQMWTPDVYEGAPSTVTTFMSIGSKAAAFAAITRVLIGAFSEANPGWSGPIWLVAVLTMIFGNVVALAQDNIKRLLAYSSIAQAGYILIAVHAANKLGVESIAFYLIAYALMNTGAWAVVTALTVRGEKGTELADYSGLFWNNPTLAGAMALFLIALAGLPLTAGFWSKFYVFVAAFQAGSIGLVIIAAITTVVSAYYYLRVTIIMFMERPKQTIELHIPTPLAIAILLAAVGTVWLFLFPETSRAFVDGVSRIL